MTSGPDSSAPVARLEPPPVRSPPLPGLVLRPFAALRLAVPRDQLAPVTTASPDAGSAGRATSPLTGLAEIVHLILPRHVDDRGDRYAESAKTLERWRRDGLLRQDDSDALYVYEQASPDGSWAQRGLLGTVAIPPEGAAVVLPHEDTLPGPVDDRLALSTALRADVEPVFLLCELGSPTRRALAHADRHLPLVDAVLADGLRHRLWALTDNAALAAIAADLRPRRAVIADGHHRWAAYRRRQAAHRAAGEGAGPWDDGFVFLADPTVSAPQVRPIHRVIPGWEAAALARAAAAGAAVRTLDGLSLSEAMGELARAGEHGSAFLLASPDAGTLRLVDRPDPVRLAAALPIDRSAAWRALDVAVLHHYLVRELWGLPDTPDAVRVESDAGAALTLAGGAAGSAVLLNPTPLSAVMRVALAGELMPRKSTLVTPKPLPGLVLRPC